MTILELAEASYQSGGFIDAEIAGADVPFWVDGFSVGGLVARYYLQAWAGHRLPIV